MTHICKYSNNLKPADGLLCHCVDIKDVLYVFAIAECFVVSLYDTPVFILTSCFNVSTVKSNSSSGSRDLVSDIVCYGLKLQC